MFVIWRHTAFTYQGKRVVTKQVGRDLEVRYLLEGSVRRSGNQIRVNAQLIDAETDAPSLGRAVRRPHKRTVRAAGRRHEPDRGPALLGADQRGGCRRVADIVAPSAT
jgi:hypothetical protein